MRSTVLVAHIFSGIAGLVIGPLVMRSPKRRGRHTSLGVVYQYATLGLCLTALGLVAFNPAVWPLAAIAVATEAAALLGWWVRRRAREGWVVPHISLMCGSYVSFVTAFLVVNIPNSPWPWIVPTVVATPLIARAVARRAPRPRLV